MHDANLDAIASLINTPPMSVKIRTATIHTTQLKTRMPFKYGIATMTEVPMLFTKLEIETNGKKTSGISSDLLPPKWFTKVPNESIENEISEMLKVIRNAISIAVDSEAENAFKLWKLIYERQDIWAKKQSIPPLLAHFGTSLVERAIIEATCRLHDQSFHKALLSGSLGFSTDSIHSELNKTPFNDLLPQKPLPKISARHTVGLGDLLTKEQILENERINDTLPQSLDECIQYYKLKQFKIKINGNIDSDLERLISIANVITRETANNFAFSLDGNEQFKSISKFRDYWTEINKEKSLDKFFKNLLFIEQPLHRDIALMNSLKDEFNEWPERPPIIIDESDGELESLPNALSIGYSGTSHKNCKGIFKGIANACLLESNRQAGMVTMMSGEDLCNVGPIAVIQDLAVMATLGIESVERNGHHYMAGLSQFPKKTQTQVINTHPELYIEGKMGWPTLKIANGEINLESVNEQPLGVGFALDLSVFEKVQIQE